MEQYVLQTPGPSPETVRRINYQQKGDIKQPGNITAIGLSVQAFIFARTIKFKQMETTSVSPFYIMGISVRTTNEHGQAATDIPALWQRFMAEGILSQIPDRTDDTIYSVYTDYEKDHTLPYTTLLGCRVNTVPDVLPEGFFIKAISAGNYTQFRATGKLSDGIVLTTWQQIWSAPLDRAYTTDFEVYEPAMDPEHAVVPVFIALQ